ncbi:MAG: TolC family protein [Candidatus Limimorpha sp.]
MKVLSLNDLYEIADSNSKAIKIFKSAVTVAENDVAVAKNDMLPNVVFSASASYNGNAWLSERDFSNGQFFPTPHFGNSFAIEASQVVFAGGSISNNVKALEIQRKIMELTLEEQKQEMYFLLTGFYLDLYKFRNILKVYDKNIEQTMQLIQDMRAKEAAGIALNNDITRYEVQLQNLKYKRTELASLIEIYNNKIVTMLELPQETEILPDTTLLLNSLPIPTETDFQDMAYQQSPKINKGRLSVDVLQQRLKVVKSGYLPQISVFAGDNFNGPITYEVPVLNNNINIWYFGIGLRYNIDNTYKVAKDLAKMKSEVEMASHELSLSEENVSLDVREAYIHYLDSYELLKTQEKSLQLACENFEVTSNRYANDLVLITDLVDADNLRLSAEVQYVNAQINIIFNYYKLLFTTGKIDQ